MVETILSWLMLIWGTAWLASGVGSAAIIAVLLFWPVARISSVIQSHMEWMISWWTEFAADTYAARKIGCRTYCRVLYATQLMESADFIPLRLEFRASSPLHPSTIHRIGRLRRLAREEVIPL